MIKPIAGAEVIVRPVAATPAEAASDEFHRRCRTADQAQRIANGRAGGRQSRSTAETPKPGADRPADPYTEGAALARATLAAAGDLVEQATPVAGRDTPGADDGFTAGAEAARALLGHDGPAPAHRTTSAAPAGAQVSTEHAAGAAEARRLLGR